MDVRYLSSARQTQRRNNKRRYILWLHEAVGMISLAFLRVNSRLHRAGGTPREDTQDAYTISVDFLPQTVRYCTKCMLGRGVLADIGTCEQAHARIHKYDLASARTQHREEGLRQQIRCSDIDSVLLIQIADDNSLHWTQYAVTGAVD